MSPQAQARGGLERPKEHRPQWWSRLLTKVTKDPRAALADPRCQQPDFCRAYFDICDGKSLERPDEALEAARIAVELARRAADPHLVNDSQGVLVHAHISCEQWEEAQKVLESYHDAAKVCCASCRSNYLCRKADLLLETRQIVEGAIDLLDALDEMGTDLDEDTMARVRFLRSIAYHFMQSPKSALTDVGKALQELSLDSPRGYFLDSLAFIGCFLERADHSHDATALEFLDEFRERIKGLKDPSWKAVRVRLHWVRGGVLARMGEGKAASEQLECARLALLKSGPDRHAAAVSVDACQLLARTPSSTNIYAIRRLVSTCLSRLTLGKNLRRRFKKLEETLHLYPEKAPQALARLRSGILAPVPGLV